MTKRHKCSQEQIVFLEKNIKGKSRKELAAMFNAHFGLNLPQERIVSICKNRKLTNDLDGRFQPGQKPWSAGRKMPGAGRATWFLKGGTPWNYRPVGSERVNGEGYVDIKIAAPNKWRTKHRVIWESVNGPMPPRHVIIFADGNNRNFELSNLLLVSRRELAVMNGLSLISTDVNITETKLNIARILLKCGERKKGF